MNEAVDHLLEALRLNPAGAESMLGNVRAVAAGQGKINELIAALRRQGCRLICRSR